MQEFRVELSYVIRLLYNSALKKNVMVILTGIYIDYNSISI